MFENVKGDSVTKLLLGTLTFLFAKTLELITLDGTSTLVVPDDDFFLKQKALKSKQKTKCIRLCKHNLMTIQRFINYFCAVVRRIFMPKKHGSLG